jgi:hypothetical protein
MVWYPTWVLSGSLTVWDSDFLDSVQCVSVSVCVCVKAHTTKTESEALGQGHFYNGNNWVDLLAKEAVGKYNESEINGYLKAMDPKKKTLEAFTTRLADTAANIKVQQMGRCRHTPMPCSRLRRRPHSFRWNHELGRYICADCGTWTRTRTRQRAALRTCSGKSRFVDGLHQSHRAWQARLQGETTGIHFCNVCGCYAAVRSEGLTEPCKGKPYHATIHRKLWEGIHPGTGGFLCKPRRVFGPSGQALQSSSVAARPPFVDPWPEPAIGALAGPGTPGFVDDPWHADEQAARDMEFFDEGFDDFLGCRGAGPGLPGNGREGRELGLFGARGLPPIRLDAVARFRKKKEKTKSLRICGEPAGSLRVACG